MIVIFADIRDTKITKKTWNEKAVKISFAVPISHAQIDDALAVIF